MTYQIMESSEKAKSIIDGTAKGLNAKIHFPFDKLEVGQSFAVSINDVNVNTLRTYASRYGRDNNSKFAVLTHKEAGLYEVARIR